MNYESSYECGLKPFIPDPQRGYWSSPHDFIFAALSLAFKMDYFVYMGKFPLHRDPFYLVFPYLMCFALFVVPIMVLQSYLGQFSSSGFISAFRVAPAFKGIGYIALVLNVIVLMYSSIFATIPLFFLVNSLRPTLPWSCEAFAGYNYTESNGVHPLCNTVKTATYEETFQSQSLHVPSYLYFSSQFDNTDFMDEYQPNHISWALLACSMATWSAIAVILWRNFNAEKFGRLIRYSLLGTVTLLLICLGRFLFLPGASSAVTQFIMPFMPISYLVVTLVFVSTYGLGWGYILTLASFNKFRTHIVRQNWLICLGFLIIQMLINFLNTILSNYFNKTVRKINSSFHVNEEWQIFLSSGSVLATLQWPNLWCILYFGMLFMCGLMVMTTQLFVTLTSIFDEFANLRNMKLPVTLSLIGFLSIGSICFCFPFIKYFSTLIFDSIFTTAGLNLLMLLVVLWVYGRERFQRDIEFMLGTPFATWKVYMMRFVTPLYLMILLLCGLGLTIAIHYFASVGPLIFSFIFILLAWLAVPSYCVIAMLQSTGDMLIRFRRVCRPTDWYPVEAEHRQRYEELLNNTDLTQQLNEVQEEI